MNYMWLLHPDAERELGAKASYAVRAAFMKRIQERLELFEGLSLGEPMSFVYEIHRPEACEAALMWCATPYAVQQAQRAGLRVPPHPSLQVLRLVHDKRFLSTHLSELALAGRAIISSEQQWQEYRSRTPGAIRVKRVFGYAGKGQRVWPAQGGKDDLKWLVDSLKQGGFIAEPEQDQAEQYSLHGYVDARGVLLGQPCRLLTDRAGAPVEVKALQGGRQSALDSDIAYVGRTVAQMLAEVGYFGPFGIDLLVKEGKVSLIDLNPRFTLGWSIGMGQLRAQGIARALEPSIELG